MTPHSNQFVFLLSKDTLAVSSLIECDPVVLEKKMKMWNFADRWAARANKVTNKTNKECFVHMLVKIDLLVQEKISQFRQYTFPLFHYYLPFWKGYSTFEKMEFLSLKDDLNQVCFKIGSVVIEKIFFSSMYFRHFVIIVIISPWRQDPLFEEIWIHFTQGCLVVLKFVYNLPH